MATAKQKIEYILNVYAHKRYKGLRVVVSNYLDFLDGGDIPTQLGESKEEKAVEQEFLRLKALVEAPNSTLTGIADAEIIGDYPRLNKPLKDKSTAASQRDKRVVLPPNSLVKSVLKVAKKRAGSDSNLKQFSEELNSILSLASRDDDDSSEDENKVTGASKGLKSVAAISTHHTLTGDSVLQSSIKPPPPPFSKKSATPMEAGRPIDQLIEACGNEFKYAKLKETANAYFRIEAEPGYPDGSRASAAGSKQQRLKLAGDLLIKQLALLGKDDELKAIMSVEGIAHTTTQLPSTSLKPKVSVNLDNDDLLLSATVQMVVPPALSDTEQATRLPLIEALEEIAEFFSGNEDVLFMLGDIKHSIDTDSAASKPSTSNVDHVLRAAAASLATLTLKKPIADYEGLISRLVAVSEGNGNLDSLIDLHAAFLEAAKPAAAPPLKTPQVTREFLNSRLAKIKALFTIAAHFQGDKGHGLTADSIATLRNLEENTEIELAHLKENPTENSLQLFNFDVFHTALGTVVTQLAKLSAENLKPLAAMPSDAPPVEDNRSELLTDLQDVAQFDNGWMNQLVPLAESFNSYHLSSAHTKLEDNEDTSLVTSMNPSVDLKFDSASSSPPPPPPPSSYDDVTGDRSIEKTRAERITQIKALIFIASFFVKDSAEPLRNVLSDLTNKTEVLYEYWFEFLLRGVAKNLAGTNKLKDVDSRSSTAGETDLLLVALAEIGDSKKAKPLSGLIPLAEGFKRLQVQLSASMPPPPPSSPFMASNGSTDLMLDATPLHSGSELNGDGWGYEDTDPRIESVILDSSLRGGGQTFRSDDPRLMRDRSNSDDSYTPAGDRMLFYSERESLREQLYDAFQRSVNSADFQAHCQTLKVADNNAAEVVGNMVMSAFYNDDLRVSQKFHDQIENFPEATLNRDHIVALGRAILNSQKLMRFEREILQNDRSVYGLDYIKEINEAEQGNGAVRDFVSKLPGKNFLDVHVEHDSISLTSAVTIVPSSSRGSSTVEAAGRIDTVATTSFTRPNAVEMRSTVTKECLAGFSSSIGADRRDYAAQMAAKRAARLQFDDFRLKHILLTVDAFNDLVVRTPLYVTIPLNARDINFTYATALQKELDGLGFGKDMALNHSRDFSEDESYGFDALVSQEEMGLSHMKRCPSPPSETFERTQGSYLEGYNKYRDKVADVRSLGQDQGQAQRKSYGDL